MHICIYSILILTISDLQSNNYLELPRSNQTRKLRMIVQNAVHECWDTRNARDTSI